jgi:NAD(P)H-hydrate epimerase
MHTETIGYKRIRELYSAKRPRDSHKGTYGRTLIIAGSEGMMGAPALAARAALRTGGGLVAVSAPRELFPSIHASIPEATCVDRDLSNALSESALSRYDAIAIGPGLGLSFEAERTLVHILRRADCPVIIDADALNIISAAGRKGRLPETAVITPHEGEAARLLGVSAEEVESDRVSAILELVRRFECTVVLKGDGTLVSSPRLTSELGISALQNTSGNPGMSTGGSGDVLTGVITSLAGQGFETPLCTAASAGVYIHGLAGDIMATQIGEDGLIASDIAYGVALAIKKLREHKEPQCQSSQL